MSNVLVLGSTGMIGSRLATEARSRGHVVTEASRTAGDDRVVLDVTDTASLTAALGGQDVLISAISPPRDGTDPSGPLIAAGRSIIDAARSAGVKRVLIVGGAGSLLLDDGSRVVEQAWFPAEVKPEALAHGELLELFQAEAGELAWTYLSPAGQIEPGERTGRFTLGADHLVTDATGQSAISAEDFAVALIDEIDAGDHIQQRFTLAYS